MTRVLFSHARLRGSVATAAVAFALFPLLLAACGSSTNRGSTSPPPSAAVGYWRSPADLTTSKLVCIRLIQGHYFLWLPPVTARAPLVVGGNRLIRHNYQHGNEIEREAFWVRPDGTLALVVYLPKEGGGFTGSPVLIFTKATGSEAQLAAELHGRLAEPTIDKQMTILMNAVRKWARQHGGIFPPRAALLPGGAFWKWRGAPHLTNAVTGGPMVLGSGAGNFDYDYSITRKFSGTWSYSIGVHRGYGLSDGLPDYTQIEIFTKATGSEAQRATGSFAEPTIDKQIGILMNAVRKWARQHGGIFPSRAALLPGGAFWKWKGAPHLTNAVTGGPMVLGSGAGNFGYSRAGNLSGSWSYSIAVHRGYGLSDGLSDYIQRKSQP